MTDFLTGMVALRGVIAAGVILVLVWLLIESWAASFVTSRALRGADEEIERLNHEKRVLLGQMQKRRAGR